MVDGIPHCDCSVRGMPSQDLEGTAPHRSPLSRIQILSSLNGLLLDLERDIFNRRGGYVERSELNKVDYDEIFKWTKDEVRGIQVEYFHEGSKPLTVSNHLKDHFCLCLLSDNLSSNYERQKGSASC